MNKKDEIFNKLQKFMKDCHLSVDRALVKARKAIMDLGLNPFDFKYKYENTNMLLGTGILV